MKIQEVLIVTSRGSTLRSEIIGWTREDPSKFVPGKPIGYTPSANFRKHYDTVMEALAEGWRLLAPPTGVDEYFVWWLVRTKE